MVAAPFCAAARRVAVPREAGRAVLRVEARAVVRDDDRAVLGDEDLVVPGDEARDVLRDAGEAGEPVPADLAELALDGLELARVELARVELARVELARVELAGLAPARVADARAAAGRLALDRVADARLAVDPAAPDRPVLAWPVLAWLAAERLAVDPAAPDRPALAGLAVLLLAARAGLVPAVLPLAAPVPVAFAAADLLAAFLLPDALLCGCVMGFLSLLHRDPDGSGVLTARGGRRPYPTHSGRRPCAWHHPPGMTTVPALAGQSA